MDGIIEFIIIFLVLLIISIYVYSRHPEKLIVYHGFSVVVDVLSLVSGILLVSISFVFYDLLSEYNYLLWCQRVAGVALFNIHLVRFVIRIKTKDKFHHARKGRKH